MLFHAYKFTSLPTGGLGGGAATCGGQFKSLVCTRFWKIDKHESIM